MDERRGNRRDKVIWQQGNVLGVAFVGAPAVADVSPHAVSDLDERLRHCERRKRELQIEIQRLLER